VLPKHAEVLARLRARFERESGVVSVIVVGSVARGDAGEKSDVDCYLVAAESEIQSVRVLWYGEVQKIGKDVGIQIGGPVVDTQFLRDVAIGGPEPARYAFTDAMVLFAHDPEIGEIVARIPVYQDKERAEKMASFASQLPVHLSYLELGEYSRNAWLLSQTAVELVLFGGRLILAHNRMLYPNRKQFMRALESAPDKPDGMIELAEELMRAPSIASARRFFDIVMTFKEWPVPPEGHMGRFQRDRETNWRNGPTALADS
jgi:predicted nucleotidyltransferase